MFRVTACGVGTVGDRQTKGACAFPWARKGVFASVTKIAHCLEVSLVTVILFPCRQIGIRDRVTFASTFQVSARPPVNVHV
jgi:hypothetical protein